MQFMCKSQFKDLWQRNSLVRSCDNSAAVYELVRTRYKEGHRHYHNDVHINHCLEMLSSVREKLADRDAVELAVWFHDIVYDPTCKDNEIRSAELFSELSSSILSKDLRTRVYQLILKTTHENTPISIDEKILMDIDLSSFGLSWTKFQKDGKNIRAEQSHLDDHTFYSKQVKFQKSLLERDRFYYSDHFFNQFEQTARNNLMRHLQTLNSMGYLESPC